MARVLVVDDHPAIRMAVSILLQQEQHDICGEADNGVDAVKECKRLEPDLLIVDIGIPMLDGIEVILRIKETLPAIRVIVLSAQTSHHFMLRCYQAGADGFISKLDDLTIIKDAIKSCFSNKPFFPRNLMIEGRHAKDINSTDIMEMLSNREMSVLRAICSGLSNKEIAADMVLSEKTVSTYKVRLMQKLQVNNMVDLLNAARQHNIIT
ncbi:response regulator transcription factor [Aeromonas hydrophila]|uniref:response regulator transcription factor n=1 Tax=Aeromonas hydrophila TaxID=644 RepID=UPI001303C14A|nr:response regulator transcription factor [Aeromonas hydrophila]QGZ71103.1 response regulator [Aeromonas hydrophila]